MISLISYRTNLNTTTSTGVATKTFGTGFRKFQHKGSFVQKNVKIPHEISCYYNYY